MSIVPTVGPAVRPAIRGAMGYKRSPEAVIRSLFSEGQQGFWLPFTDFASLSQDSAGTLPYTALEQPVGRVLDRSGRGNHASQVTSTARGVVRARVNLLQKTEDFGVSPWVALAGVTVQAGARISPTGDATMALLTHSVTGTTQCLKQVFGCPASTDIKMRVALAKNSTQPMQVKVFDGSISVQISMVVVSFALDVPIVSSRSGVIGEPTLTQGPNGTWYLDFFLNSGAYSSLGFLIYPSAMNQAGGSVYVWGASASLASQSSLPYQRVGAKYNCLINTEDFSKYQLSDASVVSNTHLAPDGTMTADSLTLNSPSSYANNSFPMGLVSVGQAVTASVFSLSATNVLYLGGATPTGTDTLQSIDVGAGWYRHCITRVFTESRVGTLQLLVSGFAPAGTGVKVVWGTQAVFGADPLPYEAVNTALDYDSIGFPKYASLDGTDDSYTCAGGGSTTGFYYSDVIRPMGGAGTQTLLDTRDRGNLAPYYGCIVSLIGFSLNFVMKSASGTFSITHSAHLALGQLNSFAVWFEGATMYAQVGDVVESVAAAADSVNSAPTLYRNALGSLQYYNGQATEPIYRAGPPPNAYEREVIRNYQMQKAGML